MYVKASTSTQDNFNKYVEIASAEFAKYDCELKWFSDRSPRGRLVKFKGKTGLVNARNDIQLDGYTMFADPFFLHSYNLEIGYFKRVAEEVKYYVQYIQHLLDLLTDIIERIPMCEEYVDNACSELMRVYADKGQTVNVSATMSKFAENCDFYYDDEYRPQPCYLFTIDLAGKHYEVGCDYGTLRTDPVDYIISEINRHNKISTRNSKGSGDAQVIQILNEHNIDTTLCQYQLRAQRYERYAEGEYYTRKFKCAGDYLAYFSMLLHSKPTASAFIDYFGSLGEFEEFVESHPTLPDIANTASSGWWGDGDDYIIYLKNLTTGSTLYSAKDLENGD